MSTMSSSIPPAPSSERPYPRSTGNAPPSEPESEDESRNAPSTAKRRPRDPLDKSIPKLVDSTGEKVREIFEGFLANYVDVEESAALSLSTQNDRTYVNLIRGMREHDVHTLFIDFEHLVKAEGGTLAEAIVSMYYRFLPFLNTALHNMIYKLEPSFFTSTHNTRTGSSTATTRPTEKNFALAFYNLQNISKIRDLKTDRIGKLIAVSGTVTRTSEVRPELSRATFTCEMCRAVVTDVEQVFRYTEPTKCPTETCMNKRAWKLNVAQSTFTDWQKVRIQENSSEIPTGSMPRTLDVILRGEIVERAKAGDKCVFTGTLRPASGTVAKIVEEDPDVNLLAIIPVIGLKIIAALAKSANSLFRSEFLFFPGIGDGVKGVPFGTAKCDR